MFTVERKRSSFLLSVALVVLATSCQGEVSLSIGGEPVSADPTRMTPGWNGPGSGQQGDGDSEPGTVGELQLAQDLDTYARLTRQEYRYVIQDLLRGRGPSVQSVPLGIVDRMVENNYAGYYKNYNPISVTPGMEENQFELAKALASAFQGSTMHQQICQVTCFDGFTQQLIPRVWKRPATPKEVVEMVALYYAWPEDIRDRLILTRIFASPFFHFKVFSQTPVDAAAAAYKRGNLLSYLVSGSFPDDELQATIDDGSIADDTVAESQIRRLIQAHPDRFATLFVPQWLGFGSLHETAGEFEGVPIRTIVEEPAQIFAEMLRRDEPISSLIALDYNVIKNDLARLYGTSASAAWEPISLLPSYFSTAAFTYLTVDAESGNPSPIKRGSYIVNHLLCRSMAFPDADTQSEVDRIVAEAPEDLSPPERMAYFRSFPACAGCHNQFDPHGLALEEIGAYGETRTEYYTGDPVLAEGKVGEITFNSSVDYSNQLAQTEDLNTCFAAQVYAYGSSESHSLAFRELSVIGQELQYQSVTDISVKMLLASLGGPL